MSLNKAIEHGKEHRKEYEDGRRYLMSYRNHKANSQAKKRLDRRIKRNKRYVYRGGY